MENSDGCPKCGMAYSFVFGVQFHKKGCMEASK
jgi:GMP synthase-like glutamine amidotransferase